MDLSENNRCDRITMKLKGILYRKIFHLTVDQTKYRSTEYVFKQTIHLHFIICHLINYCTYLFIYFLF